MGAAVEISLGCDGTLTFSKFWQTELTGRACGCCGSQQVILRQFWSVLGFLAMVLRDSFGNCLPCDLSALSGVQGQGPVWKFPFAFLIRLCCWSLRAFIPKIASEGGQETEQLEKTLLLCFNKVSIRVRKFQALRSSHFLAFSRIALSCWLGSRIYWLNSETWPRSYCFRMNRSVDQPTAPSFSIN